MRISDWSSDVCSSDLVARACRTGLRGRRGGCLLVAARWIRAAGPPSEACDEHKRGQTREPGGRFPLFHDVPLHRSEEHTSELQSLMRISYAVFCLKTTTNTNTPNQ